MIRQRFSWILRLVLMLLCFREAVSVNYHLDVTIVNHYGKVVKIITTSTEHQKFTISIGGRYRMNATTSSNLTVYITSYDDATFQPITINGKNSVAVSPSLQIVRLVYYVPTAPKQNSSTQATAATPTAVSATTDPIITSKGFAVTTDNPSNAVLTTDESSGLVSTKRTRDNATTRRLTMAVPSTKRPTDHDALMSTQLPTTNASIKAATNKVKTKVSTVRTVQDPAEASTTPTITLDPIANDNTSTQSRTDNIKTNGPTNSTIADKDVNKDECNKEGKYIVAIIVMGFLLLILLIIVVCLVIYRARKDGKTKSGILYEEPNGQDQDLDEKETRF